MGKINSSESIYLLIGHADRFSILGPFRLPRTVKPCWKMGSKFLISHLLFPAAISSKQLELTATPEAISHEFQ